MIGQTLSHFNITAKLGDGGMGEVYRAEDTKLGREVAIKVLPEAVANDPERLARFEREAKVLASLNHPNIAAIYSLEDVGEGLTAGAVGEGLAPSQEGTSPSPTKFLVMELAEGEDLKEVLAGGRIPVVEALPLARQIAEALEVAHEHGIIHRDLKPANIKVDEDGKVKVLDFGLAKALEPAPLSGGNVGEPLAGSREGASPSPTALSLSPTLTAQMTQAGIILGTAAYMAPEQATGKTVDKRADIWAFGLVCYEMLTGRRLFAADSVPETLAGVIKTEIDFEELPSDLPASIRRLLRRCLERDPRNRLHDIADGRIVIEELLSQPVESWTAADPMTSPTLEKGFGWRRAAPWTVAALMTIVAALAIWGARSLQSPSQIDAGPTLHLSRLVISTEPLLTNERVPALAISSDGLRIVYSAQKEGRRQLYLREIGDLEATPIADTEGAVGPFFSPDGERVGFAADGQLKTVSVERGPATSLQPLSIFLGGTWGEDNTIVYGEWPTRLLWRIPASGGEAQAFSPRVRDQSYYVDAAPSFISGAQAVAFNSFTAFTAPGTPVVRIQSIDSERQAVFELSGSVVQYIPTGHLVFASGGSLLAAPFDPINLELRGAAVAVLAGVLTNSNGAAQYAVSDTGTLIYVQGEQQLPEHKLVWVERDGSRTLISDETQAFWGPRLSPDGTHVSTWIDINPTQVWTHDMVRGGLTRVTTEGTNFWSLWTPDGQRLVSSSRGEEGVLRLALQTVDRSAPLEVLVSAEDGFGKQPLSWSRDGKLLLFQKQLDPETGFDLWTISMAENAEQQPLLNTPANEYHGILSADDNWLAYVSDESGRPEVYVKPFPGMGSTIPISTQGGTEPLWAPNSRELFFRNAGQIIGVEIETEPQFRASRPQVLFEDRYVPGTPYGRNFDIDATGKRFLMIESPASTTTATQIVVVQNWFSELP